MDRAPSAGRLRVPLPSPRATPSGGRESCQAQASIGIGIGILAREAGARTSRPELDSACRAASGPPLPSVPCRPCRVVRAGSRLSPAGREMWPSAGKSPPVAAHELGRQAGRTDAEQAARGTTDSRWSGGGSRTCFVFLLGSRQETCGRSVDMRRADRRPALVAFPGCRQSAA
ncbi:hypothetical protein B2J93_5377 [Marssonina coronariae]|uniref:Uncharacterized protein n=1 Tax=Diplocarpon coronariae TaxID=2795749 RepID=A0A218Z3W3_9HELO|nr:hypothetical protein B2J93_5377 [Marssonina coronariae]